MTLLPGSLRPATRLRLCVIVTRSQSGSSSSVSTTYDTAKEPVPFHSEKPWQELSPVTPPRLRAPYPRDQTPVAPSLRRGGAILPRDPTDPLCNPAAATAKEVLFVQYPYFVNRTSASGGLPVYSDKRGSAGTQRLTVIRRIDGDVEALRQDIIKQFPSIVSLYNPYNKQIVLKGSWEREIKLWLRDRGF